MSDLQTQTFDYQALDAETRIVVQQKTGEIKSLVKKTAETIIEIGQKLIEVKERLGHGNYKTWLEAEFGWSQDTANRFVNVAGRFAGQIPQIAEFAPSALYLLAAPSTPNEAVEEALSRAANGESIGHKDAKAIVAAHKPQRLADGYYLFNKTTHVIYDRAFTDRGEVIRYADRLVIDWCDAAIGMAMLRDGYQLKPFHKGFDDLVKMLPSPSSRPNRFTPPTPPDMSDIADVPGDDGERGITREEYESFEDDNDGFDDEDDYDDNDAEYPGGFDDDDDEIDEDEQPPAAPIDLKPNRAYLWCEHREAATDPLHAYVCIMSFDQADAATRWAQDVMGFFCPVSYGDVLIDHISRKRRPYTIMKMEDFISRFGRKPQPTQTPILVGAPLTDKQMGDEILSRLHVAGIWDGKTRINIHALPELYREVMGGYPVTALIPVRRNNEIYVYLPQYAPAAEQPVDPLLTSDSDEWYTPKHIIAAVLQALGGAIDLDPCNSPRPNVPANRWFDKHDDGLNQNWTASTLYMNPPFSLVDRFIARLADEYEAGNIGEAITLVAARTDTAWFRRLAAYPRCFIAGRLRFLSPNGESSTATFPSVAIYLGTDLNRFAEAFKTLGDIYIMWR